MGHHPNPRILLTPLMRGVIDRVARAGRPPMHAMTPVQAREFYESAAGILDISPHKMTRVETLCIPTRDGHELNARLVAPALPSGQSRSPVLLYLHGGGFTIGSTRTHDNLCRHLAHLAQCAVVSVDYRLAPEHKFPTAVNDAWDSLVWLANESKKLNLDGSRLAVGGDSAGGTLSLVCAVMARDAGLPLRIQLLFYPGCAAHQDTSSHETFSQGFMLDKPSIDWFFGQYLRSSQDRDDWRFSPLNAPDLDGVAPAWMGLAECDPLVDEGVMMADRLRLAGVPVDLDIYRGVVHGFIQFGRAIPEALQAHQDAARALRSAFGSD